MTENRPILAIETSGGLCGVCAYFNDDRYFESSAHLKNSHAEKLFELVDFVIKSSSTQLNDFEAIAVSAGPGSFTGLRIGMSAAKGLAFGSGLPIIPVPTFEALALQICDYLSAEEEFIIANKVNLEEIYYAKFRSKTSLIDNPNNYIFVENLKIISRTEFQTLKKDNLVYGNAGSESDKNGKGSRIIIEAPSSLYVARWNRLFGKELLTRNYDYLEPNYLKNFIVKERKK